MSLLPWKEEGGTRADTSHSLSFLSCRTPSSLRSAHHFPPSPSESKSSTARHTLVCSIVNWVSQFISRITLSEGKKESIFKFPTMSYLCLDLSLQNFRYCEEDTVIGFIYSRINAKQTLLCCHLKLSYLINLENKTLDHHHREECVVLSSFYEMRRHLNASLYEMRRHLNVSLYEMSRHLNASLYEMSRHLNI